MKILFCFLFSLRLFAQDIDQKSFYLPNTDIDVLNYNLSLAIDEVSDKFDIPAILKIELKVLKNITSLKLHSRQGSVVVIEARVDGVVVSSSYINDYVLEIDKKAAVGKKLQIELVYKITKEQLDGELRGLFYNNSVLSIENWPYYTRRWMPCNDSPFDPAQFEVSVSVPESYLVMSNGALVQKKKGFFHWKTSESIPTYGINLVIGKYKEAKDILCIDLRKINNNVSDCSAQTTKIPLHMYLPEKTIDRDFQSQWRDVKEDVQAVGFFSSMMGMYAFEKVGFVDATQSFNMEYPSLITKLGANVHEIAHHWFGDSVFIGHWGDLWVSEGFTTYLDLLYNEAYGENTIEQSMTTPDGQFNYKRDTDPYKIFDNKPYDTGAASVHALRKKLREACEFEVGNAKDKNMIYAILRSIYQTYKRQRLETWELVNFLDKNLGSTLKKVNCTLSQEEITSIVHDWSKIWFHQVRE